jgi:dTDP-4-amino-4,6-dideoxygalactose transaminase
MTEPIRLARPDVGEAELAAIAEVVRTGQLTMGAKVEEFERAIADAVGTAHAAVVSSGTAALHVALLALEIGPGDEVIVPAYTFPATANAVELCGARAVLVDIDPDTFNLDVAAVAAAVTPRTRAACLSFHPRKIVTTGEGGAVTTDEAGLDAAVRRLRHHGWRTLGDMPTPGFNYRLPDLLCAVGIPQLERLRELLAARTRVADWYTERLEHHVLTPSAADGDTHGWQAYVVQLDRRDEALAALRAAGIEAQIGTWAVHRLEPYRDRGAFPGADRAFERALALPFATTTTEQEVERVAAVLTSL